MSKFNTRRGKDSPAISTASLPDIVFMLLFFFMTVTKMRETEILVKVKIPQATEITKIIEKRLVHYLLRWRTIGQRKRRWNTYSGK